MSNITRVDRKNIQAILFNLEHKRAEQSENFSEELERVKLYLDELGVSKTSEYRTRLEKLIEESRGRQAEENQVRREEQKAKIKQECQAIRVADYCGFYLTSKNHYIPVIASFRYDHLFLSKRYGNLQVDGIEAKVSWRFESDGMLYLVDLMELPSREIFHIINSPTNKEQINEIRRWYWRESLERVMPIFSQLKSLESKLELLLKFGYTCGKELLEALRKEEIKDFEHLFGEQRGLSEIANNAIAMRILKNVSNLTPRFTQIGNHSGVIAYQGRV